MSRRITGTLSLPGGGNIAGCTLRFIAAITSATVLQGTVSEEVTNGSGVYDITLENGTYNVTARESGVNRQRELGQIIVATGADTTLNALLN
jgi:hypothetical protein